MLPLHYLLQTQRENIQPSVINPASKISVSKAQDQSKTVVLETVFGVLLIVARSAPEDRVATVSASRSRVAAHFVRLLNPTFVDLCDGGDPLPGSNLTENPQTERGSVVCFF